MTALTLSDRAPFRVHKIHQFNLSDNQTVHITAEAKKMMPSIIRLAKLMRAADPSNSRRLILGDKEELEVKIRELRYLVHKNHFPLIGYDDDEFDELMTETVEQWMTDDWMSDISSSKYHPLLNEIPVNPMGIPDHDIQIDDCYDVVGLLYWLGGSHPKPPRFNEFKVEEHWEVTKRDEFKLTSVLEILPGMNLQPPLIFLVGMIKSVLHQTETGMPARLTFFLDACPLCGSYSGPEFTWTVENFIWFRDDWLRAKPIYDGNQELIKWSQGNGERLAEISTVLKRAQQIHLFYKDQQLPDWC